MPFRDKKNPRLTKKQGIAVGTGLACVLLCAVLTAALTHKQPEAVPTVLPESVLSELPTEPERTESDTQATTQPAESKPAKTTKPVPKKPVGTTAQVEREEPALPEAIRPTKPAVQPKKLLDVPFIDQRAKYPTGCESVAAVMAMQYFGISVTPEQFIDRYLDKGVTPYRDANGELFGDDPRKVFLGNPYSATKGWGCWAPVIVEAMRQGVDGDKFSVRAVYGQSLDTLCKSYIDRDIPVLIWATQNMRPAENGKTWFINGTTETFTWIRPMHCLLLVGYDADGYYFNDSLQGKNFRYTKAEVHTAYRALQMQAVVLQPKPPETTTEEQTQASSATTTETTVPVSEPTSDFSHTNA